jgi:hypothetical protein
MALSSGLPFVRTTIFFCKHPPFILQASRGQGFFLDCTFQGKGIHSRQYGLGKKADRTLRPKGPALALIMNFATLSSFHQESYNC